MPNGFADFSLSSIIQKGPDKFIVTFTKYPLTFNSNHLTDALNHQNYSIVGLGVVALQEVKRVDGFPEQVELRTQSTVPAGPWTLVVQHVTTYLGEPLHKNSLLFTADPTLQESIVVNPTTYQNLVRNFNPAYRNQPVFQSILTSLSTGDQTNQENYEAAYPQFYVSSASGFYLDRLCGDRGIGRPKNIGLPDDLFRSLTIKLTDAKITQESILEILEIFYGTDAVRAHAISSFLEPFALQEGDTLEFLFDEKDFYRITFRTDSFQTITSARALEVAFVLNEFFKENRIRAYAVSIYDPLSLGNRLYLYSPSLGLVSSVRILGGRAQNVFQFPFRILAYNALSGPLPTWNITKDTATNLVRFTSIGMTGLDLLKVVEGDYVTIYGNEFLPENRGTFFIHDVSVSYPLGILTQYFEILNPKGINQTGLLQLVDQSLYYFTPEKQTIQKQIQRTVIVAQGPDGLHIQLPATTQAVGRTVYTGAYLNPRHFLFANSLLRKPGGEVTVFATAHGVSQGDVILVDSAMGVNSPPPIISGDFIGPPLKTDASLGTVWSALKTTTQSGTYQHTATRLLDDRVLIAGGFDTVASTYRTQTELFTPTAKTILPTGETQYQYEWNASASLPVGIGNHQAVLFTQPLKNGEVLVTGGFDGTMYQAASYLYTPDLGSGTWTTLSSMTTARAYHQQVEFFTNFMGVCGGLNPTPLASVEVYDPVLDLWSVKASMSVARYQHRAILLQNGHLLVVGGKNTSTLSTCEIYDPFTDVWRPTGSMTYARFDPALVLLEDGQVMVMGGQGFNPTQSNIDVPLASTEIYDPTTGQWRGGGQMSIARSRPNAAYFPSLHKIYVTGGASETTDLFDTTSFIWAKCPAALPSPRPFSLLTPLSNGSALVTGGLNGTASSKNNFLFIPNADRFLSGGLNGIFTITSVVDANHFTYLTPHYSDYTFATSFSISLFKATPALIPGPYLFDPKEGLAITGIETTLTQLIEAGKQYKTLLVASSLLFPDEHGWIVVGFGQDHVAAPVEYFGRISTTELAIGYNFVFPHSLEIGSKVTLLYQKGTWVPPHPERVGSFYLTDSPSGRVAASATIDLMVAAGVKVTKTIVYPGDYGLGGMGLPEKGQLKLSDKVIVWGGENLDEEIRALREESLPSPGY